MIETTAYATQKPLILMVIGNGRATHLGTGNDETLCGREGQYGGMRGLICIRCHKAAMKMEEADAKARAEAQEEAPAQCGNRWQFGRDVCARDLGHAGPHKTTKDDEAHTFRWFDNEGRPVQEEAPAPKAPASRATHYVHQDGTVSTRNSKTRVYAWAIEEKRDLHAEARDKEARAEELEEELASFDQAIASGEVRTVSSSWPRGQVYVDFYAGPAKAGERHWMGSEVRDADGRIAQGSAFDLEADTKRQRDSKVRAVDRARQAAQELASGPRYGYSIVRWSERQASAEAAESSFQRRHATYRIVRAQEGKPSA